MRVLGGGIRIGGNKRPAGIPLGPPSGRRLRVRADDDVDYIYPTFLGIGQAHGIAPPDDESPEPSGVIWVPDPEQRHGWRERYITKPSEPKPGARPMGFRRP